MNKISEYDISSAAKAAGSAKRTYVCIDLKSFYASVECVERGLDPLTTNLIVADETRTDQTICLAVSPSLKAIGVPGRPRLFEARQKIREAERRLGKPVPYIVAVPNMATYIRYTADIYSIYLRYVAPEDIHVYSVDEVFMDITAYRSLYRMDSAALTRMIIRDVLNTTGITATAGLGTNMYLAKVAMDIVAKRMPPDADGVRMAQLDEEDYCMKLWDHVPLTDFWQVGSGTARRLANVGIYTMGDIAVTSVANEDYLYSLFGINAELLIDHAWGIEPCTMEAVKAYVPVSKSVSNGQVLPRPYSFDEACVIVREMADLLSLELTYRGLAASSVEMYVGYEKLSDPEVSAAYRGPLHIDHYGRVVPKHAKGTVSLRGHTASSSRIIGSAASLFERICDRRLMVRRIFLTACNVVPEQEAVYQLDLFTDHEKSMKEMRLQKAVIYLRDRYGKNAVLKGVNLMEGARTIERNLEIGGHRAGP